MDESIAESMEESWLDDAIGNFQEAIAEGNLPLARAVIADMRTRGHDAAADFAEKELSGIAESE